MTTDATNNPAKRKEGIGYKILLGIAGAIGIGWAVLLVIIRVLGIVFGIVAGVVIGIIVIVAAPEASALIHWLAFLAPPLIVWGAAELFIFFYPDPLEAFVY
jgi:hypothetical protein